VNVHLLLTIPYFTLNIDLPHPSISHSCTCVCEKRYASEHVITGAQKTLFRDIVRDNRKKHDRHNSLYNLSVIERCTNCWWNPIHSLKLAQEIQERNEAEAARVIGTAPFEKKEKEEELVC
jgi:hypothetical protein